MKYLSLLNKKKELRKNLMISKNDKIKVILNKLNNEIKTKIKDFRENKWCSFLEKHGKHPVSTRPFWAEINKAKNQKTSNSFPILKTGNSIANDDKRSYRFSQYPWK